MSDSMRELIGDLPDVDLTDVLVLGFMAVMVGAASFVQTRTGKIVYLLITIAGIYSWVSV